MITLYPYQQDLIDRTRKYMPDNNVMIVSPPGSGKSVVIAEIAKLATEKNGHVLFLVHRKELIEQIENTFKFHGVDMDKVDLFTVIKAKNRLNQLTKPTLIITDEGHHGKASTYKAIYDFFDGVPKLGFTATPWRMNGDGFTDTYDTMVEGKSVQWLIENHRLAPYKYYSLPSIDIKKLKVRNGEYSNGSIDEAIGNAIFGNVVDEYLKHVKGQQAILYAHSIKASEMFSEEFNQAGITSVHVDSKTPKKEREEIMQSFRDGDIKVLCNVDLISEGFDVPDCSVTFLCRPTKSLVLYLQQSMRSMRYQPNKQATIIDTVLNWKLHELPDYEHNWEEYFEGGWKKHRSRKENEVSAKECPECNALWPLNQEVCDICGHVFEKDDSNNEKHRLNAELELIEKKTVEQEKLKILANKKFNTNLENNWKIAQARAKLKGGKPLYKLIYFYSMSQWAKATPEELEEVTGASQRQIFQAYHWIESKMRKGR